MQGIIKAINISEHAGTAKHAVTSAQLEAGHGIKGDAHAGSKRQVSLLAWESIVKMQNLGVELQPGSFAENITTEGLDLPGLKVGDRLQAGAGILLEITQIGKECHRGCEIRKVTGDCVMPREGLFARILKGGKLYPGDNIEKVVS